MVRSKTLARRAWWSEPRWPEPGVRMISTSRPSSLKNPSSPATSKGRSWMAFIIDAFTFLNGAVMAASKSRPPLFCHFLLPRWPRGRGSPRPRRSARELRTEETVILNVAAAEQWTGVRICSADRERVATRPGVGVVGRVDLEPKAVLVHAVELALARQAFGKAGDDGSMNGLTRALVLQRQMAARRLAPGSGNENERRLAACISRDPPAAADPVLARGPAGRTVDLGVGAGEGDVSDRLQGDRVLRPHVQRVDNELAGRASDRRHLLVDDHAAVRQRDGLIGCAGHGDRLTVDDEIDELGATPHSRAAAGGAPGHEEIAADLVTRHCQGDGAHRGVGSSVRAGADDDARERAGSKGNHATRRAARDVTDG